MSEIPRKEFEAFVNFFATFKLVRPVSSISDLSDGTALFDILSTVDEDYFRPPTRAGGQPSDNWVLRFSALKRLYRLMTQYFTDVLQKPTSGLEVPDLQALAKDHNITSALGMCRLTIAIGVHCEKNKEFIEKIQSLSETDQHHLMKAIEQTMARITPLAAGQDFGESTMTEDDHYYRIQSERGKIFSEKMSLEKAYQALLEEHRSLQSNHDDLMSEKEDALAQLRELKRETDSRRHDKSDTVLRAEIERLRTDLQKSEDNLAIVESDLDKHTNLVSDMKRKMDELQVKADEAERLKDQLDEYRHAADKLQKTENVMEKYKKKLQESADLRQRLKALEKQNADLVDKNASIEEEYRKVAAFKPLIESYKNQISDMEAKNSARTQEIESLKFELEQSRTKLRISQEERAKDAETLELYQERVRELELMSHVRPTTAKTKGAGRAEGQGVADSSGNGEGQTNEQETDAETAVDLDDHAEQGLGGELDDAITGTTMTDLKIQIKKLQRELDSVRKNEADTSRLLVLENLLEDANRMKTRYENDYLAAHREKLILQRDLEEIRSGKALGDGAEAAIALRQRLNETVEQFEQLRKGHADLEVKFDTQSKELTIAKSDLNLVNKDQLDILATLRESVNEDKATLETELDQLKKLNKELSDKNRMQLEQVNALLLEKVTLQSDGIGQREKMLQRERAFGELRATLSGKDLPEDVRSRLLALQEENISMKEANKNLQERLLKARQFIKQQDKMVKDLQGSRGSEEADTRIKVLEEEVARYKTGQAEMEQRYRREQELMMSAVHSWGMKMTRQHVASQPHQPRPDPSSWLNNQRRTVGFVLRR